MHVLLISFLLYISLKNHNFPPKKYTEVISCLILIKIYCNILKAIMYVVFCSCIMVTFSERGVAFTFFAVGLWSGLLIFIVATIQW
jgi:hypothetical protein